MDPSTVLGLILKIGESDPGHDWYLTALVPTGEDLGHKRPDPTATAHLSIESSLVGLLGWGLYMDAECVAVYTSDNRLHRNGGSTPIYMANSIWEAVSLFIEVLSPVLPPASPAMPA